MKKLRIFVASPSDVKVERETVSLVVQEIRRTLGDFFRLELEAIRWETHAWPDIGDDAQDVINRKIGEYDILIGIMWRRFGTPTNGIFCIDIFCGISICMGFVHFLFNKG